MASKRYKEIKAHDPVDNIQSAVECLKASAGAKFDESIDVSFNLNVLKKHTIRDVVVFPNAFGESPKVAVFAKDKKAEEAKQAGADHVGDDDLIEKIQSGWLDFKVAIATPDMMKSIAKVAKILGTKGLMPNPKTQTVTNDVKSAVEATKAGRREVRMNKEGVINFIVGKASMSTKALVENMEVLCEVIRGKKPVDLKGDYVRTIYMSSTMGKSVRINNKQLV